VLVAYQGALDNLKRIQKQKADVRMNVGFMLLDAWVDVVVRLQAGGLDAPAHAKLNSRALLPPCRI
jgi:hypothetical protein